MSNIIIGAGQKQGVYCKGACTLKNVWFRAPCEGQILRASASQSLLIQPCRGYLPSRQWRCFYFRRRCTELCRQGYYTQRYRNSHHQGLYRKLFFLSLICFGSRISKVGQKLTRPSSIGCQRQQALQIVQ